jgi:hypothetical protein
MRSRMNVGLVVMIDADEHDLRDRIRELDQELTDHGVEPRQPSEAICPLVPKRNIETWIYSLRGEDVNEHDAYPHLKREGQCQDAVEAFVNLIQRQECNEAPLPSLRHGCREMQTRLPES